MPQVPVTQGNSVTRDPRVVGAVRPMQLADGLGQGAQALGRSLVEASQQEARINEIYDDAAAKKIDLYVADKAREILWTGDDPFFSKKGFAAQEARPDVESQFRALREEALGMAKNDRQRNMLDRVFETRLGGEMARVAAYAIGQFDTEFEIQTVARRTSFQADAVRNAHDPARFGEYMAGGLEEISSLAQHQTWSPDREKAEEDKFVDSTVAQAISGRLAVGDTDGALALLGRYGDNLLPTTRAAIDEKMTPVLEYREDSEIIEQTLGAMPLPGPDGERTPGTSAGLSAQLAAIESNESNGKHWASKGVPKVSTAGAIGLMQIMPSTGPEAARLAGLPWSLERLKTDPEYNKSLGAAYYREQLRRFGDPALAAAAYNAGPGAVQSAILRARKSGKPDAWANYLPQETKDYVRKFSAKTGGGASRTGEKYDMSSAYAALEARSKAERWQPEDYDRRRRLLDREVDRRVGLEKLRDGEEWDAALETVVSLGQHFTSVSQIPNSHRLPPERLLQLENMAEQNLAGTKVAANGDNAINLGRMSIQDPDKFMTLDLREYKHLVSPGEYAELQKSQARLIAKPDQEKSLLDSVNGAITFFSTPEQKLGGDKNKLRRNRVANAMLVWLRKNVDPKKTPTDSERRQAFGWAVGEVDGINRGEQPAFDVPAPFIEAYGREYKRNYGDWPTDAQVRSAYQKIRAGK